MPEAQQNPNGQRGLDDQGLDEAERQREVAMPQLLPQGRLRNVLLIGVLAGILSIAQSVIITLVNAPTYHAYDAARDQVSKNSLAFTIFGYAALTFFITMLICLLAGYIAGRVCIQRRSGFLAGFVIGIVNYGASFITRYIPGYPGNQQAAAGSINNAGTTLGGIALFLAFLLVWGLLTGLVSLLGAWIATRRHPFYKG